MAVRNLPVYSEGGGYADGFNESTCKGAITMKFDVNKYYRVERYSNNGYRGQEIMNGFRCKIITSHCEYDEASDLWINHHTDCAYEIEEYHK